MRSRIILLILMASLFVAALAVAACEPAPGPAPTPTPTPKPTPGEDFKFSGVIQSMGADIWVIGGQTFKVDAGTILDTRLAVGVNARVEYIVLADGTRLDKKIETP